MADNVPITAGTGTSIAADDVSSVFYQKVKIDGGGDGVTVPMVAGRSADAASFPVALSTEDVALVGALTETAPGTDTASSGLNGRLQRIAQRLTSMIAQIPTALGATTMSASMSVTIATDDARIGIVTETAPGTDTASSGLNGRLQRIAQRLTTLLAVFPATIDTNSGNKSASTLRVVLATDQPALTNKLLVTPDSVALPANQSVNVAQVNGTTTVNGGSAAGIMAVGGPNATNVAITGNPTNLGAQAVSAENTAVTANRLAQLVTDLVGKLIVLPYANPENFVSGAITSAMTGTTSTSLIAAPASGLRNYITQITVSNSHATVGTDIIIQDGSGGTTLYTIPAAAVYGGAVVVFPTPLRQPTTATAIYCANVTTGASTKVSASGYKGA